MHASGATSGTIDIAQTQRRVVASGVAERRGAYLQCLAHSGPIKLQQHVNESFSSQRTLSYRKPVRALSAPSICRLLHLGGRKRAAHGLARMVRTAGLPVGRGPPRPAADTASRHAVKPAAVLAPSARMISRCRGRSTAAMQQVLRCGQPAASLCAAQPWSVRRCMATPGQQQQAHVSLGRRGISCRQTPRPCRRRQLITCLAAAATLARGDDDDDQHSSSILAESGSASLAEAPSQDGERTASAAEAGKADEPLRSRANTAMIALRCAVHLCASAQDGAHSMTTILSKVQSTRVGV